MSRKKYHFRNFFRRFVDEVNSILAHRDQNIWMASLLRECFIVVTMTPSWVRGQRNRTIVCLAVRITQANVGSDVVPIAPKVLASGLVSPGSLAPGRSSIPRSFVRVS
jgi:hypothetical protein